MFSMILSGLICGALLGFVMQRGRFCLTGGFRDMYIAKNNRMFYALLIAISVQSVGVFALIQAGLLTYEAGAFPVAWYCYRWVSFRAGNCSGGWMCHRDLVSRG
ncbi:inner membrane protein [Escherichia coli]|uniref:Inner membrane protein n=1 Tax=Escherichia coli TaxID=562 RepID=A0A376VG10_ECOLX|nr:inner membrane protein [Escherichia coli]